MGTGRTYRRDDSRWRSVVLNARIGDRDGIPVTGYDSDMDDAEYARRIDAWRSKWTANRNCPLCQTSDKWIITPIIEPPLRIDETMGIPAGKALPIFGIVCQNCGYTMFVSGIVADVTDTEGTKSTEPPKVDS
jgi:hypothetical protein